MKKKGNPRGEHSSPIKKNALSMGFKASENLTTGRLGGLTELNSACQKFLSSAER